MHAALTRERARGIMAVSTGYRKARALTGLSRA